MWVVNSSICMTHPFEGSELVDWGGRYKILVLHEIHIQALSSMQGSHFVEVSCISITRSGWGPTS